MAHGADLEELLGLGLYALGAVDDHDSGVGRHQGTVGILREILVSGGIQDIDAASAVLELQDRAGDRDTSLLLDLHPVGNGMSGSGLALYGAGQVDGASVKKEFFRQGSLAGIRVGYDCECTSSCYFFGDLISHEYLFKNGEAKADAGCPAPACRVPYIYTLYLVLRSIT